MGFSFAAGTRTPKSFGLNVTPDLQFTALEREAASFALPAGVSLGFSGGTRLSAGFGLNTAQNEATDPEITQPSLWTYSDANFDAVVTNEDSYSGGTSLKVVKKTVNSYPIVSPLQVPNSTLYRYDYDCVPGQTITLSGRMKNIGSNARLRLFIRFRDAANAIMPIASVYPTVIPDCSWQYMTATIVVPVGAVAIDPGFYLNNDEAIGNGFYLDNIEYTKSGGIRTGVTPRFIMSAREHYARALTINVPVSLAFTYAGKSVA